MAITDIMFAWLRFVFEYGIHIFVALGKAFGPFHIRFQQRLKQVKLTAACVLEPVGYLGYRAIQFLEEIFFLGDFCNPPYIRCHSESEQGRQPDLLEHRLSP